MKREVQSLKSELRALRTSHLSTSEVRLPWTPEEKLRHESNGHTEFDNRCQSARGRVVFPDTHVECTLNPVHSIYASVTFKESDGYVTVLTGRGTPMRNASVELYRAKVSV